ncbi:hypothetical protein PDJAM_G00051890 [Pangasius djambal]|uniref:Uncharacterized protein n=1 Tax=Pangasius djambal TaxID=1691987 RepID=A0ACC5YXT4_9TELE|nr:hypothetical protein [Pangasius djambal]
MVHTYLNGFFLEVFLLRKDFLAGFYMEPLRQGTSVLSAKGWCGCRLLFKQNRRHN